MSGIDELLIEMDEPKHQLLRGLDIWAVPDLSKVLPRTTPFRPDERDKWRETQRNNYYAQVETRGRDFTCPECGAECRVHPANTKAITCGKIKCRDTYYRRLRRNARTSE